MSGPEAASGPKVGPLHLAYRDSLRTLCGAKAESEEDVTHRLDEVECLYCYEEAKKRWWVNGPTL